MAQRALDAELDALLGDAIARGVCSAAAVAVGDGGREVLRLGGGRTHTVPAPGEACGADAIFDLASLTKPIATAALAMRLVDAGALELAAPASRWLGAAPRADADILISAGGDAPAAGGARGVDPRVAVAHLLGHGSGLPPHVKLYERLWAGERAGRASAHDALIAMAAAQPLDAAPGERAAYSDLGYILAGAVLEAAGGAPLDELFAREVAAPLGLAATRFVALEPATRARPSWPAPVVATELDGRGLVTGEVHDENAHAGGGVHGHAGLFGPVADVSRFAAAIVAAARDDGGSAHRAHGFAPEVVRTFFATRAAPDASWRLGWDTPSATPGVSHAGDRWPRDGAVGHLGFTGTSLWIDLPRRRWVVLLTNRVHPRRDRPEAAAIKELRRGVGDAVVAALGG